MVDFSIKWRPAGQRVRLRAVRRLGSVAVPALLATVAAVTTVAAVASVAEPVPAGAAVRCFGPCVAEIADPTVRSGGAIGLIGDSVLMGVDPWIASDLAAAGWGPFHYWAG